MSKLRKMAKGRDCTVRLGRCNGNSATVVGAHIRRANIAGMGQKPCDLAMVYACSDCHDVIDGRVMLPGLSRAELDQSILFALCRTLAIVSRELGL